MVAKLYDAIFGCRHGNYSFPMTTRRGTSRSMAAAHTGTYVVCLDCGKELSYDWKQMRIVNPTQEVSNRLSTLAVKEAV